MRKISVVLTILLMSSVWLNVAEASIARGGGGARPAVGNRSAGFHGANVNRGDVNRANVNRGSLNRGNVNAGNVNRGNINRANINRNADVHGWGNHYWADDNHWGWGSFAGGAAAAATGAAVGAAVANRNDVAAAAPAPGTVVASLPAGCSAAGNTDQALYNCGGVQYQPAFQGSDLMYQAVGQP